MATLCLGHIYCFARRYQDCLLNGSHVTFSMWVPMVTGSIHKHRSYRCMVKLWIGISINIHYIEIDSDIEKDSRRTRTRCHIWLALERKIGDMCVLLCCNTFGSSWIVCAHHCKSNPRNWMQHKHPWSCTKLLHMVMYSVRNNNPNTPIFALNITDGITICGCIGNLGHLGSPCSNFVCVYCRHTGLYFIYIFMHKMCNKQGCNACFRIEASQCDITPSSLYSCNLFQSIRTVMNYWTK